MPCQIMAIPSPRPSTHSVICHQKIKLDNPVHCGYMLTFCETEFNRENLSFIIAVDRLRDNILVDDTHWRHNQWREIDADFGFRGNFFRDSNIAAYKKCGELDVSSSQQQQHLLYPESVGSGKDQKKWPSQIVDQIKIEDDVNRIWAEFIDANSPSQICLSSTVVERTAFRMKYLHIYGPDVFTEAIEEHLVNTVEADTLPRFSNSVIYQKMSTLLCALYAKEALEVPVPANDILRKSTFRSLQNKLFELFEILSDGILYSCLLQYLSGISSERSLLCLQMICVFEDEINQEDDSPEGVLLIEQYTWEIYRYFLTGSSEYEIQLGERDRKEIMRNLAKPVSGMFYSLRLVSFEMVEAHFELYTKTDRYLQLNVVMMDALDRLAQKSRSTAIIETHRGGCFNF